MTLTTMQHNRLPLTRIEQLRQTLLETVGLLWRRRASEIPAGFIDDYVTLDWLEWRGGSLRLTVIGENVSRQESNRLQNA
jgi:hypothetical protein